MRFYACGDSFTYGEELEDPLVQSWPAVLAKFNNASLTNCAQRGGTNYRTMYQTIKNLSSNFDFYIIAWSSYERFTFYKNDNNFDISFNPQLTHELYGNEEFYSNWGKTLYNQWYNELFAFKLWLQQIVQMQLLLKNKKYIMVNTFENQLSNWLAPKESFIDAVSTMINIDVMNDKQIFDEYKEIQYYISLIDTSKFYKWNNFFIVQLCSTFKCGPNGHFLNEGHIYLANLINQHICSK